MNEDMHLLERDLNKKNTELRTLETSLTSERDSKKLLTVKIKEMDLVIQQQTELIQLMQTQLQKERDLQLTISVCVPTLCYHTDRYSLHRRTGKTNKQKKKKKQKKRTVLASRLRSTTAMETHNV